MEGPSKLHDGPGEVPCKGGRVINRVLDVYTLHFIQCASHQGEIAGGGSGRFAQTSEGPRVHEIPPQVIGGRLPDKRPRESFGHPRQHGKRDEPFIDSGVREIYAGPRE